MLPTNWGSDEASLLADVWYGRAVKSKRDYLGKGNHFSWLYLSRLAALKRVCLHESVGRAWPFCAKGDS
jgi:hypothetical protein